MAYIKKEPIVEFITKGLNNPDKTKAYGYDAIEILTEIEYAPTADVVEVEKVVEMFAEQFGDYPCNLNDNAEWLSILEDCDCNCSMKCWEKFVKHYGERK